MNEPTLDNGSENNLEPQFYGRPVNFIHPRRPPMEQPPRKKRWWLYFIILIIMVGGVNCAVRSFSLSEVPTDAGAYDPLTLQPRRVSFLQTVKNYIFKSENVLAGESDDRVNILLLGMGGVGHDGPFLSDTNIILSLKPSTKEVSMVSIPRDLGVQIPKQGVYKINFANAFGEANNPGNGGEFAREIFAKTFNLDIPYYIRVDFKAFEDLINAVGGVTIDVPRSFTDNEFPGPNETYAPINFISGVQTMNGERALQYARSRHGNNGEGSDFARARRQQQVLSALKERLLSFGTYTNPVKIQQMLTSLSSHITTNLNFGQIMYLAGLARSMNNNIKTLVLDNSPSGFLYSYFGQDGAFLLGPRTGNFDTINETVKNIFEENIGNAESQVTTAIPASANRPVFPTAKIEIQNGTWRVGLAAKYQVLLEAKGFTIASIGNSAVRPLDKTALYIINQSAPTEIINNLEKEMSVKAIVGLPNWLTENFDDPNTSSTEIGIKYRPDTDILVLLGDDAEKK